MAVHRSNIYWIISAKKRAPCFTRIENRLRNNTNSGPKIKLKRGKGMAKKEKSKKSKDVLEKAWENNCPRKDGDDCLESGVFNDSDPIGGGG